MGALKVGNSKTVSKKKKKCFNNLKLIMRELDYQHFKVQFVCVRFDSII